MKGHQAVVGTCDVRNDRQATAELVDLLNAFADKVYPETDEESSSSPSAVPDSGSTDNSEGASPATPAAVDPEKAACGDAGAGTEATGGSSEQQQLSVEEMIRKEADALRAGRGKTRRFQSVNTFVKGVVMVCVVDPQVDALRLVDAMFEEIRETRKRRSRFLERVTPMQTVAFSELEAFKTAAEPMVANALPPVAEGVPPLVLPAATKAPAAPVADEPAVDASSSSSMAGVADEEGKTPVVSMAIENATQEAGEPSGSKQPSEAPAVEAATVSSAGSDVKVDGGVAPSAAAGGEGVDDDKKEATKGGGASNGASNGGSGGEGAAGGKTCDKRYRFRVDVRRRNSGLKRMDLINAVANSVGAGHSVSMATPDVRRRRVRVRVPSRASKQTATLTFVLTGTINDPYGCAAEKQHYVSRPVKRIVPGSETYST